MKITYDKEADAPYICLLEAEYSVGSSARRRTSPWISPRANNSSVSKCWGASRLFEKPEAPTIGLKDLLPKVIRA
jgi:hypothetical protein